MQPFSFIRNNIYITKMLAGVTGLSLVLVLGVAVVSAQEPEADLTMEEVATTEAETTSVTNVGATVESFSLPGGPHFFGGESVQLAEDLAGDVFVAGGTVGVSGTVDGDVFAAGGNVTISGDVVNDVRVAGGNVTITGNVGQNVTVAGGNVTLAAGSSVGKSVMAAGGTVNIDADVTDNVLAAGGTVTINGSVGQDVRVESGLLTISPTASIGGNLTAKYDSQSDVSPEASIAGTQHISQMERTQRTAPQVSEEDAADLGTLIAGAVIAKFFYGVLAGFVSGAVLFYLFKTQVLAMAKNTEASVVPAIGWGFVYLIGAPVAMILLMATVLGLPLGFYLMFVWIMSLMAAGWLAAYLFGRQLYTRMKQSWLKSDYLQLLVGLVILQVVYLLPVLGGLVKFLAVLIGLGAIFVWSKNGLSTKSTKKSK